MSTILKYIGVLFTVVVIIALIVVFTGLGGNGSGVKIREKAHRQDKLEYTGEQYRISFNSDGDRSQIIDLIKGRSKFYLAYSGISNFNVKLLYPDGRLLVLLANENGPYEKKQVIDIPETGAYLLDVKTSGEWSFSRD